jgi:RNA polymerase sigma-70 factor (ECF subfamily)
LRRRRLARVTQTAELFDFQVDRRSPETHLAGAEEVAILHECLAEMTPKCRQAVLMSRLEGRSSSEIAKELKVTTRMVRTYIAQALLLIRQRLDGAHGGSHEP